MKIKSIRIENFRSFKDVTVPFNEYTCLVGPNGAGKSTVLMALNVFFRESDSLPTNRTELEEEDFHCKNTDSPVKLTITFCNLNNEAKSDFLDYVQQEQLVILAVAKFNRETGKAPVKQYGECLGIKAFQKFFKKEKGGQKSGELKDEYNQLRESYSELPEPTTKDKMKIALQNFESKQPDKCEFTLREDEFYGFPKGENVLEKYVQWVYVPAIKDATSEQVEAKNSALGKLLERTVRSKSNFKETIDILRKEAQTKYQKLLDDNQGVLKDISSALQKRITQWAHSNATLDLQWKQDPNKSVRVEEPLAHILAGEDNFKGELTRFGHGFQRSYLLALLQELAETNDDSSSTLILACEEPELYQHPPQVRYLAATLGALRRQNTQVIVSTHSPLFISGEGFEDVRMIHKGEDQKYSEVYDTSFDKITKDFKKATQKNLMKPQGILAKIHQALQPSLNEMFFTRRLVLVEGLEDIAYLKSYLFLLEKEDEFQRLGGHIVATNGKSQLLQFLIIARHMKIPTYVIFDADANQSRSGDKKKHKEDNCALLTFLEKNNNSPNPFPEQTYSGLGFTMWHDNISAIVKADIGENDWKGFCSKADDQYDHAGNLHKNSLHIGASLNFAWKKQKRSDSLEKVCNIILKLDSYV